MRNSPCYFVTRRMPFSEKKAEDSSLKNQLTQSITSNSNLATKETYPGDATHDDEKQNVNNNQGPALEAVTDQSATNDVEKGVLRRSVTNETHRSNVSMPYEDKDDFPEGGLKGWGVVLGAFCGSFR